MVVKILYIINVKLLDPHNFAPTSVVILILIYLALSSRNVPKSLKTVSDIVCV